MVARLPVAGSAGAGRQARSGDGVGGDGPSAAAARERRRGAARRLRPCARGRPACRHHDVGAVALPAREPPALPAPPRRSGGPPARGVGVSGGGRSRAVDADTGRSPRLWPQHHRPGAVRPVGSARRGHWPLLVAGPLAGVAGRFLGQSIRFAPRHPSIFSIVVAKFGTQLWPKDVLNPRADVAAATLRAGPLQVKAVGPRPDVRATAIVGHYTEARRALTRFGGPEVLDIVDVPEPTPGPGQQLYDVSAAGINYADTRHRLS